MGDFKVGAGGNDFPRIQLSPKAAEEPTGRIGNALPNRPAAKPQASEHSDITPKALAKRTANLAAAGEGKSVKGGIKADARIAPNAARQENATTIAARTETYGQDAKLASLIFADANIGKSGYLNAL
ncbi:MAG: hypothetical protein LBD60_03955 [Puniceicoccales bacterium]|jgi:hypothetical protein|nr:hypothetical protein [Puniceicoccales bacterium]